MCDYITLAFWHSQEWEDSNASTTPLGQGRGRPLFVCFISLQYRWFSQSVVRAMAVEPLETGSRCMGVVHLLTASVSGSVTVQLVLLQLTCTADLVEWT